jgi:hypothetical protein
VISQIITTAAYAAYALTWLAVTRFTYLRVRPMTEPACCTSPKRHSRDGHKPACYQVMRGIQDESDARFSAFIAGATWPLAVAWFIFAVLPFRNPPPRPEEITARNRKLEKELGIGNDH